MLDNSQFVNEGIKPHHMHTVTSHSFFGTLVSNKRKRALNELADFNPRFYLNRMNGITVFVTVMCTVLCCWTMLSDWFGFLLIRHAVKCEWISFVIISKESIYNLIQVKFLIESLKVNKDLND